MTFAGLDGKLEKLPQRVKKIIGLLSGVTLEIYVVQYVLIDLLRPIGNFPLNWLVLTVAILVNAFILHKVCEGVYHGVEFLIDRGGDKI